MEERSTIKIKSIQAASLYRVNNGCKYVHRNEDGSCEYRDSFPDFGNAVIHNSLFAEYVRRHGGTVNDTSNKSKTLETLNEGEF